MSPRPPLPEGRDDRLGGALSGLPVPDHGPTFWADLADRLSGDARSTTDATAHPDPTRARGETTVPHPTESATEAGSADPTETTTTTDTTITTTGTAPVSLDERRARRAARRDGRTSRSRPLGAAAAAVALVVAVAGAVTVFRSGDNGTDRQVRAADRPTGTAQPAPAVPAAPAEFSATYDGLEGFDGPGGCCSTRRLTLANDGSFRWTSTDGGADLAYDATTGRHVDVMTIGPGISKARPNYFVTTGVPAGGPDQRVAKPDPLDPIADFVTALARAGDTRITTTTVAGRAAWHYDGATAVDRLGGD
ncbi:MAG TPA: hypothetical protein VGR20_24700, partial [Acidimicrobiia bacterium]|nr:hypothetical protein [Acidimicrobiia bacterium]